jgi:hypothetical protein
MPFTPDPSNGSCYLYTTRAGDSLTRLSALARIGVTRILKDNWRSDSLPVLTERFKQGLKVRLCNIPRVPSGELVANLSIAHFLVHLHDPEELIAEPADGASPQGHGCLRARCSHLQGLLPRPKLWPWQRGATGDDSAGGGSSHDTRLLLPLGEGVTACS